MRRNRVFDSIGRGEPSLSGGKSADLEQTSMNTTSKSLLLRLSDRSQLTRGDAWTKFTQLYTPLIFYWARKMGLSASDAADLVQEVMAIVLQKIGDFHYDSSRSFRGWLRTVTLNQYRQQLRKEKLNTVDASASFLAAQPDLNQAEQTWDQEYARTLMANAMNMIKPDFSPQVWAALEILMKSGRSVAEVAAEQNIRPTTLYSARIRLMRRLKEQLEGLL